MIFPTVEYAFFFLLVFILAWLLRHRFTARKILLLVASYVFYGWWDWRFCFLMFASAFGNYLFALALDRIEPIRSRRLVLILAVTANLLLLGLFKYYGFFLDAIQDLGLTPGDEWFFTLILPIGISFFTFQGLAYVIDVFRREIRASSSALDVLLFISFFPHMVAGPIVRAGVFLPQLQRAAETQALLAPMAALLIVSGLFKKMVIANYLGSDVVEPTFFGPAGYGTVDLMIGVYAFAVQIFCDFSAYSDIAIGSAALLGITFPRNFERPYRAASISEFWRRWHISLSTWLRDYLYIPLGGNRHGLWRTNLNLMLVMVLGGLWHGAAWAFIIWGAIHGVALVLERTLSRAFQPRPLLAMGADAVSPPPRPQPSAGPTGWRRWLGIFVTFHIVCAAWVFFRAGAELQVALDWFGSLGQTNLETQFLTPFVLLLLILGMSYHAVPWSWIRWLERRAAALPPMVLGLLTALAMIVISGLAKEGTPEFIYFAF